jgi:fructosamine-3-kinase
MEPISGGNTHPAFRLVTEQGRFFLKLAHAEPGLFTSEARSLEALAQSGTSLRIPPVLGAGDSFLCLDWIEPGHCRDHEERLGVGLAELHHAQAHRFGFDVDTWCGPTRQPNRWHESFVSFYAEERLAVVLELAHQRGAVENAGRRKIERLLERLPQLLSDVQGPPRLIHGDLWSGNVLQTSEGPALVDPASAYSHPEAELGMMLLFGGFSRRTLDAYLSVLPLAPGWKERNHLFQLYHLLNHAAIFGGSYGAQAVAAAGRI